MMQSKITYRKVVDVRAVAFVLMILSCITWILFLSKEIPVFSALTNNLKGSSSSKTVKCDEICHARQDSFHDLVKILEKSRDQMVEKIKVDYGEDTFLKMFVKSSAGEDDHNNGGTMFPYRPFRSIANTTQSYQSWKRKLKMKILSVHVDRNNKLGCECVGANHYRRRRVVSTDDDGTNNNTFATYVWVTAGNSVAAGHGNLFNESYTAYLERRAKDVFASVGIRFEGRNYARGSTESGPEDSMCFEATYGQDVDVFTWDYGITDSDRYYKLFFSLYRAGKSPGRPVVLARGISGRHKSKRLEILEQLESMGLPTFYDDDVLVREMEGEIPDMLGLSIQEIDALPEYVRAFKCNGGIERGEPFCDDEKWTKYFCPDRKGKTNWHPG
jgi:hypothetical protein